jgi:formylglycine-generating enzyme required for sulfatase activity
MAVGGASQRLRSNRSYGGAICGLSARRLPHKPKDGTGGYGFDSKSGEVYGSTEFSWRGTGFQQGDDHPVVNVSWMDAMAFCEWLSTKENRRYRLPTTGEWEVLWAASGADHTARSAAGLDGDSHGNVADKSLDGVVRGRMSGNRDDCYPFTCPVCAFLPSSAGVYGIRGNVREWSADVPGVGFGDEGATDRSVSEAVSLELIPHTVLGTSWDSDVAAAQPGKAPTDGLRAFDRDCDLGFRVVVVTSR